MKNSIPLAKNISASWLHSHKIKWIVVLICVLLVIFFRFFSKSEINTKNLNNGGSLNNYQSESNSENRKNRDNSLNIAIIKWDECIKEISPKLIAYEIPKNMKSENYVNPDFLRQKNINWSNDGNKKWLDQKLYEASVSVIFSGGSSPICEKLAELESMPPSDIHVISAIAVYRALEEFSKIQDDANLDPWLLTAKSQHAIFRLLAVEASSHVSINGIHNAENPSKDAIISDAKAKLDFYKSTINDPVDMVKICTIEKIGTCAIHLAEAKTILQNSSTDSNIQVANAANNALNELSIYEK